MTKKEKIIESLKSLSAKIFPNKEGMVYLYGSQARGDENKHSDWDILVLTKDKVDTQDKYDKFISPFSEIGWYNDEQITPINYTIDEWGKMRKSLFYHNVMSDAIEL